MGKIIRLDRFNVGCRHHANGICFPHIYRASGFEYDMLDEGKNTARLTPGNTVPVETFYTLSEIGDYWRRAPAGARLLPFSVAANAQHLLRLKSARFSLVNPPAARTFSNFRSFSAADPCMLRA
jgi:hypothetical protein